MGQKSVFTAGNISVMWMFWGLMLTTRIFKNCKYHFFSLMQRVFFPYEMSNTKKKWLSMGPPQIFQLKFFYQNDSEWPKMDTWSTMKEFLLKNPFLNSDNSYSINLVYFIISKNCLSPGEPDLEMSHNPHFNCKIPRKKKSTMFVGKR